MKASKLREQSNEELRQMLGDMSKEFFDLRLKKSVVGSAEQPLRVRSLRRDLARVKTIIREREREAPSHG